MTITDLQTLIGVTPDGAFGPVSKAALWNALRTGNAGAWAALLAYVAGKPVNPTIAALGAGCAAHMSAYDVTENGKRLANFIGQAAHESGGFRYMREIWGPTPAQRRYEGRADLGNVKPGDGHRYMGRGIFQLTGRANYGSMGARLNLDLEGNPSLAETPDVAVLTALEYWHSRNLSALADEGREDTITRRINGGENGIQDRRRYVAKAKGVLV